MLESANATLYDLYGIFDIDREFDDCVDIESIMGFNVIGGYDDFMRYIGTDKPSVFFAIGSNEKRKCLYEDLRMRGISMPNLISEYSRVSKFAVTGEANFIAPFAHIGPLAKVGSCNIFNTASNIEHEVTIGSFNHIAPGSTILGRSSVGDNCLIGANSSVLPGLSIPSRTTIGAGAVVIKSPLNLNAKLVGVPAR